MNGLNPLLSGFDCISKNITFCRQEVRVARQSALEFLAKAKLWAIENKESSSTIVADLQRKVEDLEAKVLEASQQTSELFFTANKMATEKLGAEVKLNNFVEARRRAAAISAVQRLQQAGLKEVWSVWAHLGTKARLMAVAAQRIMAQGVHFRLATAIESWFDVHRAARSAARANAFAIILRGRRTKSVLKWWTSAAESSKWTENVLIVRARLAEIRGMAQCQLLFTVLRAWDEFTELASENSNSSLTSANVNKFVAC